VSLCLVLALHNAIEAGWSSPASREVVPGTFGLDEGITKGSWSTVTALAERPLRFRWPSWPSRSNANR
jgi:hypothetical protein